MDFILECRHCGRAGKFHEADGHYERVWCICGVDVRGGHVDEMIRQETFYHGRSTALRKTQSQPEIAEPPFPPIWEFRLKPEG